MISNHPSVRWGRLTLVGLVVAALPLLTVWNWWPAAPAAVDPATWPAPPGGTWERPDEIAVDFRDELLEIFIDPVDLRIHPGKLLSLLL